jgi:hypothetical protein
MFDEKVIKQIKQREIVIPFSVLANNTAATAAASAYCHL